MHPGICRAASRTFNIDANRKDKSGWIYCASPQKRTPYSQALFRLPNTPFAIMSTPHITLSAASDDRKARLAKLKSLKRKQPEDEVAPPESDRQKSPALPEDDASHSQQQPDEQGAQQQIEKDVSRIHLSGRNYDAETKGPKLGFEAPPTLGPEEQTLEEQAAELEAELRRKAAEEAQDDKGIDLFKLQPKKPNWDLKRELNKKLEVLNVRTDNAIAKLVRERLQAKKVEAGKGDASAANGEAVAATMDGGELEEIVRLREREEEEEERREREAIDAV
ncbi:cwf18 pre-mRNA splicing factor-domain-containing protein [Coniella lustricola]|uniref:Cwf18 pre-mRNA splicing factor-domain-containing protein n=1 Tax=Coniella lustricola TaxID=2025994 RepID=A0A2T3A2S8_9PEZI|nr:cwf18 pre-mRNA splicing factor-domain-containing protein [Coniella lustricola]